MTNNAALVRPSDRSPRWLAALCSLALCATSTEAVADTVSPSPKGITGGALLGAELVVITEAAFGIETPWLYAVGAVAGAGGGATGGYFIEKTGDSKLSLYMLLGGMALVIPTSIVYLNATAYDPAELDPATGAPPAARQPLRAHVAHHAPSLLQLEHSQWSIAVPNVTVEDVHTRQERVEFGLPDRARVSVSVLSGHF